MSEWRTAAQQKEIHDLRAEIVRLIDALETAKYVQNESDHRNAKLQGDRTSALAAQHVNRENGVPWCTHSDDELWAILRARVLYEPIFKDKRGDITRYPSSGQCLDVMRVLRDRLSFFKTAPQPQPEE